MSTGEQNRRVTRALDHECLEELAKQSVRAAAEPGEPTASPRFAESSSRIPRIDERPTREIDENRLLALIAMIEPTASTAPSDPTPEARGTACARVVRTRSGSGGFMTQRMQAKHFQALLQDGRALMPITPALLESVDWYREADAAAGQARTVRREPEELLEELARGTPGDELADPAAGPPGSSPRAPEPATSPEAGPSRSRLDSIEMPPIFSSGALARYGAELPTQRTIDSPPPAAHSAGPQVQVLISLIVLAVAGAFLGLAIVDAVTWLVV